jgi:septal ring factor EnvC (AmiA/AmiB activator)
VIPARPILLSLALLALAAPGLAHAVDQRKALAEARRDADSARRRAEKLEADASAATAAADRTAREAAAVAARIQQAEAEIVADEAAARIIGQQRDELRTSLAAHEWPLLQLTAALQRLSRRPPVLALLHPGSAQDAVHLRAVFETTMPEVRRRTAALREQLARARQLQQQAIDAQQALRAEKHTLTDRQRTLAALETSQRLAARDVGGSADRETERANTLAEQARDLGDLVGGLEQAAALRERLAALPGPLPRPARPGDAVVLAEPAPQPAAAALPDYVMPVAGELVAGFGDASSGATRGEGPSRGVTIAARPGAQVVAPTAGRVAFAGAYRGFGQIVILDHPGGWTSLVTGLGILDVRVGDVLVGGAPLGIVGPEGTNLTLELRHDGQPVNPLEQMRLFGSGR